MSYVIAVIILVIASVGFAYIQAPDREVSSATPDALIVETTNELASTSTNTPNEEQPTTALIPTEMPAQATPEEKPTPSPTPAPSKPTPAPTPTNTNDYTNGTYTTQTSYRTPDGTYQMDLTVTVTDDSITGASVGFDAKGARDGYSKRFASSFKGAIIGKDLGTASLSRVGGASLTTRAFNTALGSIKSQAS